MSRGHTYTVLAIARRHPSLFALLLAAKARRPA
jgi:hypothetical protein